MPKPITQNTLFYGDNLPILREHLSDESVDLIYLDPPFNSNRSYNVLFREESGQEAESQITAFEDTWHWNADTEKAYHDMIQNAPVHVVQMIGALREFIGANQMMAYLVMMAARLVELQRVLKPTGSLYLHCDPTASHYIKLILDAIFSPENFRNEIIWQRINAKGNVQRKFGAVHDVILGYSKKLSVATWNQLYRPLDEDYVAEMYRYTEEKTGRRYRLGDLTAPMSRASSGQIYEWKGKKPGPTRCWVHSKENMEELEAAGRIVYSNTGYPQFKRYLDENPGEKLPDIWDDIPPALGGENLGYPTQKPLALLERIIQASSNEGDLVLDPFCGCGTAIAAAKKLNRKWVGIDITHLSISLMKYRLKDMYGLVEKKDYAVIGEPEDAGSARQLAHSDRYQFQWWALSLVHAKPLGGEGSSREGKKGSDKGIDGVVSFLNEKNKTERILVQVKSGHVKSGDIRDLRGSVEREGAAIGVFITLEEPTKEMITEAVSAGYYHSNLWQKDYPLIQILTVEDLFAGKGIDMPASLINPNKQAPTVKEEWKGEEFGVTKEY
jgi:site-specific DNA-methyltransferase (adenine-specific)